MKKQMTEVLDLLKQYESIKDCIPQVIEIRETLQDEEKVDFVNFLRGIVQDEATSAVIANNGRGVVAMATGSGKSKVGVNLAEYYIGSEELGTLLVPTEKLRDENWKEEFYKWDNSSLWESFLRYCYASASKVHKNNIKLAILDEGHNITNKSAEFFINNKVTHAVLLTATVPTSMEKLYLLQALELPVVYTLTLDEAIALGFVAPYKIMVVTVPLDTTEKYVPAGNKNNPFFITEEAAIKYVDKVIEDLKEEGTAKSQISLKFAILKRMNIIYKLKSKTKVIKYLLDNVIPKDDRTLIFCGSIDQANQVCENRYHSKTKDTAYNKFKTCEINRLSCVKGINEGHNFPGMDSGLIGQLNSKEKDIIQRIGRLIRFRPGHEAKIWIVVSEGTQDMIWLEKATENLDQTNIQFTDFRTLQKQLELQN